MHPARTTETPHERKNEQPPNRRLWIGFRLSFGGARQPHGLGGLALFSTVQFSVGIRSPAGRRSRALVNSSYGRMHANASLHRSNLGFGNNFQGIYRHGSAA